MVLKKQACPDCDGALAVDRRSFLKAAGTTAAVAAGALPTISMAKEGKSKKSDPESITKYLYESLSDEQKSKICFDWNHVAKGRGLLRTHVSNNWHITKATINSDFYTKDQRKMVRDIFEGIIHPQWLGRIDQQIKDDAGGFGEKQNIAIFGKPGDGKFELVMTGRHMTLRCDGNSTEHVAFGGPIFYGHAAQGFREKPDHPGNVFWEQAKIANNVYKMLDGKQQKQSLVAQSPRESSVAFRDKGADFPGLAVSDMSSDQKEHMQKVLAKLIEPYRTSDQEEALACLKAQGGLDKCSLAFYADKDIGKDGVWDNWRLEGPSFVWYFRGAPHVHVLGECRKRSVCENQRERLVRVSHFSDGNWQR